MEKYQFNHPAISSEWAMREFPDAREAERRVLLDAVRLEPGMTVLDVQAAGGFLSDGVYDRLGGQVHCVCVEPVDDLNCRIDPRFEVVADPIDRMASVGSASVDVVLGLAGLHHSPSKDGTIAEVYRVLKPEGEFAVCDVIENSPVSAWLNDFVDTHNPLGHKGDFLLPGEASERLRKAGFRQVREQVINVPWTFQTSAGMARFFRGLFGLTPPEGEIGRAIPEYLHLDQDHSGIVVDWELIYAYGRK